MDDDELAALLGEAARRPRIGTRAAQAASNKLFPLAFIRVVQAHAHCANAKCKPSSSRNDSALEPLALEPVPPLPLPSPDCAVCM